MIYVKSYELPPFDEREILRYAGVRDDTFTEKELLHACMRECEALRGRVCHTLLPVSMEGINVSLGSIKVRSRSLAARLRGCESACLFAATIGVEIDRLIHRYSHSDMPKALWIQAIGTERVEALCDVFCAELRAASPGGKTTARFSPGYGDLPLSMQKDIVTLLDCRRKLGMGLNESLLLSPSKSVTAIVGVK